MVRLDDHAQLGAQVTLDSIVRGTAMSHCSSHRLSTEQYYLQFIPIDVSDVNKTIRRDRMKWFEPRGGHGRPDSLTCDQFETRGVDEVSTRPRLREDARNAPRLIDHAYGVVEWDNWKSVRDLA